MDLSGVSGREGSKGQLPSWLEPPQLDASDETLVAEAIKARLFPGLNRTQTMEEADRIGRFSVLRRVGKGGMGVVYAAYDEQLDRKIAIKLVRARFEGDTGRGLLEREARRLARLSHPNVVQIHEIGDHGDGLYIAMEFVVGQTLRLWLKAERPWREVLAVLVQAGRGLEAAHAAGLVHRDFKPDNVMVGDDGRVRVLDFGLASVSGSSRETGELQGDEDSRTKPSSPGLAGTPMYMAPELFEGREADAASDQWALCVAAYEALFGVRPFQATSLHGLIDVVAREDPAPPARDSSVPQGVLEILRRGLDKDPARRWPELGVLLAQLEAELEPPRPRSGVRTFAGLAGAGLAALLGLGLGLGSREALDPCPRDSAALAGVWDAPRRAELVEIFDADAAAVLARRLDQWATTWADARHGACVATRVEGTRSSDWLDRHGACLELQRHQVQGLLSAWASGRVPAANEAGAALIELPDPGLCASPLTAGAAAELPSEPEARAALEAGYEQLGRASSLAHAGEFELARAALDDADQRARAHGFAPLEVESLARRARLEALAGDHAQGVELLGQALSVAVGHGFADLEVELRLDLAHVAVAHLGKLSLERWLVEDAARALASPGAHSPSRELRLLLTQAKLAVESGELGPAREAFEAALALDARQGELLAPALHLDLANALAASGDHAAARVAFARALELSAATWGERSPALARVEFAAGLSAFEAGDLDGAGSHWDRAAAIYTQLGEASDRVALAALASARAQLAAATGDLDRAASLLDRGLVEATGALGEDADETVRLVTGLGVIGFMRGDYEGALEAFRRALEAQRRNLGEDHREVALLHSNVGESLLALGHVDAAAVSFARALEILEPQLPARHPLFALPLKGRGLCHLAAGEPTRALIDLRHGLELALVNPEDGFELADLRFGVAQALVLAVPRGADASERAAARAEALDFAREAERGFAELGLDARVAEVQRWSATLSP